MAAAVGVRNRRSCNGGLAVITVVLAAGVVFHAAGVVLHAAAFHRAAVILAAVVVRDVRHHAVGAGSSSH